MLFLGMRDNGPFVHFWALGQAVFLFLLFLYIRLIQKRYSKVLLAHQNSGVNLVRFLFLVQIYLLTLKMKGVIKTSSSFLVYPIVVGFCGFCTIISGLQVWYWVHKLFDLFRRLPFSTLDSPVNLTDLMALTAWTFGPTGLAFVICTDMVENRRDKDCKSIVTEISDTFFGSPYPSSSQPASDSS
jgi:hypothetical protein